MVFVRAWPHHGRMKTNIPCSCANPLTLPDGGVGMEEERWQRVEDWLLNHLADVQDRAFIIMPRDLAAYEEMMRRCGSGFSGSVRVPAASESVFTDAAKVDLDAAKVDSDAVKVNHDAVKVDSDERCQVIHFAEF
jgi:hypothetical protein